MLTATRQHRRPDVVDHVPAAVWRAFTLWTLSRLAAAVDPAELDEAAGPTRGRPSDWRRWCHSRRRERAQVPAELDDVVNPYRRSDEVYQESSARPVEAVRVVGRVVLGVWAAT